MIGLIKGTARQVKSVSGLPLPIATYNGNLKAPIKKLSLSVNPTQSGSGDPSPDNIRPITGVSSVNVTRTGKNLISMASLNKGSVVVTDGVATGTSNQFKQAFDSPDGLLPNFPFKQNTAYSFSADVKYEASTSTSYGLNIRALYTDGTYENMKRIPLNTPDYVRVGGVSASNKTLKAIYCAYNSGANNQLWMKNVQIEEASTPTDYSPYQGNTYTIDLDGTRYGATLDVVRGKLRVTNGCAIINVNKTHNFGVNASGYGRAEFSMTSLDAPKGKSGSTAAENVCDKLRSTNPAYSWNYGTSYSCAIYTEGTGVRITASTAENTSALMDDWLTTLGDIMLIYPLATPIEIDLTPTQINSLLGQNNIWHDGNGNVDELVYVNRQLYYGR